MPYCSACGEELGPPNQVLHDPDNLSGIIEGGVENPEDNHLEAKDGPKGPRLFCSETGQVTKIDDSPEGGGSGTQEDRQPKPKPDRGGGRGKVYDFPDEESAMDILEEVVATPVFGLDNEQIQEVMSWGDIYDYQVPPDVVENLLKNLSGISKQKASLMRQKYEAKLNKWVQKKSMDSGGPSIGVSTSPPMPSPNNGGSPQRGPPQPQQGGQQNTQTRPTPPDPSEVGRDREGRDGESLREKRRERRVERRNDALDVAAERFAEEATREMAQDIGGIFGDAREIAYIAFKKKAKKDPDWFFEKMEKWDMDILDAVLEPSEARKREQEQGGGSSGGGLGVDMDVDEALEDMEEESMFEEEEEQPENTNRGEPQEADTRPMSASPHDEADSDDDESEDEDEAFEQLMGDTTE